MPAYVLDINSSTDIRDALGSIPKLCPVVKLKFVGNESELALLFNSPYFPSSITSLEISSNLLRPNFTKMLPKNIKELVINNRVFDREITPPIIKYLKDNNSPILEAVDLQTHFCI